MIKSNLTRERLQELVHYDPATGIFTARVKRRRIDIGDVVGSPTDRGYLRTSIDGTQFYLHRLAFLYVTGSFPGPVVDHRDGDVTNNSFHNLREADNISNGRNRKLDVRSTSMVTGVCWLKKTEKWRAHIKLPNKRVVIGCFENFEDAVRARNDAEVKYFGDFRRTA